MAQAGLIRARVVAVIAAAALQGCVEPPRTTAATVASPSPFHVVPGSLLLPPAPAAPRDTCGAAALAGLVGAPRSRIPVAVDLSRRRVSCTACPVAPDVRLDRVNILYDARTGLVTKVTCG